MDIIVDTSVLIAVLLNEPLKANIVAATAGYSLIAPGVVPWEIGNALSAMFKRKRIELSVAQKVMSVFKGVPIRYVDVDFSRSLRLANDYSLYAYDAYFLDCAERHSIPLVSLDVRMIDAARKIGIEVKEVA